jgi:hypothetical protein
MIFPCRLSSRERKGGLDTPFPNWNVECLNLDDLRVLERDDDSIHHSLTGMLDTLTYANPAC